MKWTIDDNGDYGRVVIREVECRNGSKLRRLICFVQSPAEAFVEPTDADRDEMLRTAQEIVRGHNEKEHVEAALVRSRQGWRNAIELGMFAERHHEEARSIIAELTAALAVMGSERTLG